MTDVSLERLRAELRELAEPRVRAQLERVLAPADGDELLGVRVPVLRRLARTYRELTLDEVDSLLRSRIHEERFAGLLVLAERVRTARGTEREALVAFYLARTGHVDNWDLVDGSAPVVLGPWLLDAVPDALDPRSVAVDSGLSAVDPGLDAVGSGPSAVDPGLDAVDSGPSAVNSGPDAVGSGPGLLDPGSGALDLGSDAVGSKPDAVGSGSDTLDLGSGAVGSGPGVVGSGLDTPDLGSGALGSGPDVVDRGPGVLDSGRGVLARLAGSASLWERRIAVVATLVLIRAGRYEPTFELVRVLRRDPEPLIHKALGWMLREIGRHDERALVDFLDRHASGLPRVTVRNATERLDPQERARFVKRR